MTTNVLVFGFGAILLLVGILGGGFELRELKVPKVSRVPRAVAGIMGFLFITWGVELGTTRETPTQPQVESPGPQHQPAETGPRVTPGPTSAERNAEWHPSAAATGRRNQWAAQVRGQLVQTALALTQRGYELTHEAYTDTLYTNSNQDLNLTLDAGKAYALVGVCDNDCSNLDLVLYDQDGNVVDKDFRPDVAAVVEVTPSETASYRLRVIMAGCRSQPCYYGVGVFGG
jgi:hypothetical protein